MNNPSRNLLFYRSWKQDLGRQRSARGHAEAQGSGHLKARAYDLQARPLLKCIFLNFTQAVHKHKLVVFFKKKKKKGEGRRGEIDRGRRAAPWGFPRRWQREPQGARGTGTRAWAARQPVATRREGSATRDFLQDEIT